MYKKGWCSLFVNFYLRIVDSFEMTLTSIVQRENLTDGEVRITGNDVAILATRVSSMTVCLLTYFKTYYSFL